MNQFRAGQTNRMRRWAQHFRLVAHLALSSTVFLIMDIRMQFFLYEVLARIVASYLCIDCFRRLRTGLAERKITMISDDLLDWTDWNFERDVAPIRYWMVMGGQVFALVACLVVAIFGWWQPKG